MINKKTEIKNILLSKCRDSLYRILSQIDTDKYSQTYGCCDRHYWSWKLVDFPDATLQRLMYSIIAANCTFTKVLPERLIIDYYNSVIQYSQSIQHDNGSFDQAFPNEYSIAATSFILFDHVQSYILLQDKLSDEMKNISIKYFKKCADFIVDNYEAHGIISNHLAGIASALLSVCLITNNQQYSQKANSLINSVLNHQSEEGWFFEYSGFDPGYETLCLYYLSYVYEITESKILLNAIYQSIDNLVLYIHPNGTLGGEYGSRNTKIFYPGGIIKFYSDNANAKTIIDTLLPAMANDMTTTVSGIDIHNMAPLINNYLRLLNNFDLIDFNINNTLPCYKNNYFIFKKHSGNFLISNDNYYHIISLKKGGVFKSFNKNNKKKEYDCSGLIVKTTDKKIFSTQMPENKYTLKSHDENNIEFSVELSAYRQIIPKPFSFFLLRLFNMTFGRSVMIGNWLKNILVKMLVTPSNKSDGNVTWKISFNEPGKFILKHELSFINMNKVDKIEMSQGFSAIHMATSKYWQKG